MTLLEKLGKPFVVRAVSLGVLLGSAGCATTQPIHEFQEENSAKKETYDKIVVWPDDDWKKGILGVIIYSQDESGELTELARVELGFYAWSPNGRYLAFVSSFQDSDYWKDVMIADNETGSVKQLTDFIEPGLYPYTNWSPTGEHIAFARSKIIVIGEDFLKIEADIFIVDHERNVTPIAISDKHENFHSWSPTGEYLAFLRRNVNDQDIIDDLYVSDLNGNSKLIDSNVGYWDIEWIPGENTIQYKLENEIKVIQVDDLFH